MKEAKDLYNRKVEVGDFLAVLTTSSCLIDFNIGIVKSISEEGKLSVIRPNRWSYRNDKFVVSHLIRDRYLKINESCVPDKLKEDLKQCLLK